MADLFISYSRRNKDFVQKLHAALAAQGHDVWIDWEDIPPTVEWWKEIQRGIESANAFVFVISPASVNSRVCREEIEHAVANNKRIIPLLYEPVDDPALMEKMHPTISATNWIFFDDPAKFESAFQTFIEALNTDYEYVREHTRLLIRARDWERNNRERGYLLSGESLRDAEAWLTSSYDKEPKPLPLHSEYIVASQQAENQAQRARTRAISAALVITMTLAIIAAVAAFFALRFNEELQDSLDREIRAANEIRSRILTGGSEEQLLANNTELAILLALEANNIPIEPPLPEAQLALANAAYAPGPRAQYDFAVNVTGVVAVGNLIVAADATPQVVARDITTGTTLATFSMPTQVTDLSAADTLVAVGLVNGGVYIIDLNAGAVINSWNAHAGPVNALDLIAIGGGQYRLATVSDGGQVTIWNANTGTVIFNLNGHALTESVNAVRYGGGGAFLVTGSDRALIVWDTTTGTPRAALDRSINDVLTDGSLIFHTDRITAVAMSPTGDKVVTGSADTTLKVWRFDGSVLVLDRTLSGHTDAVSDVAYSPDGFTIVSSAVAFDESLIVWDAFTGAQLARLEEHTDNVNAIDFVDNGLRVVSASDDNTVLLWDIENGALIARLMGPNNDISDVAYSSDGNFAAASSRDGNIYVWNLNNRTLVQLLSGHDDEVLTIDFSPDGRLLASGSLDQTVRVWDANSGALLQTLTGHTSRVLTIDFSPDGLILASGGRDDTVIIWDMTSGALLASQSVGSDVNTLDFSDDGQRLLVGTRNRRLLILDRATLSQVAQLDGFGGGSITSARFSPDGTLVLLADSREAKLIDAATGNIIHTLRGGHRSTINSVAFSPDGRLALTGAADALLVVWDVASGEPLVSLDGHRASINGVAFGPAGTFAISGGSDDVLLLWRIDSLNALIEWTFKNRLLDDEFTCEERETFLLEECGEDNVFPTRTPFLSPTAPIPAATITPQAAYSG